MVNILCLDWGRDRISMVRLEPIGSDNLAVALRLLSEGFPDRPPEFWRQGLARADATARRAGIAPGQILQSRNGPAGIILTFGSRRDDRPDPVINLSAWYVSEGQRFLAPAMLKAVTSAPATYTDLTPTDGVVRLSKAAGFSEMRSATAVIPLAAAAMRPGLGSWAGPSRTLDLAGECKRLAVEHEAFGCLALAIGAGDRQDLILLRRTAHYRVPAAEVIYGDRRILKRAIGPLARVLLRHGLFTLLYDCRGPQDLPPLLGFRRSHGARLVKGTDFGDVIDYAWSELAFLNL